MAIPKPSAVGPERFEQTVQYRLDTIRDLAESGVSEMTGRAKREYWNEFEPKDKGEIKGRHRGLNLPELQRAGVGPKTAAAAIRRGKGKVFQRVRAAVLAEMAREGISVRKVQARIPAHRGTKKCVVCKGPHTKGQHRFHGAGSWERTHIAQVERAAMRKNSPGIVIYGKLLRIEAQKTQKHMCDSACKKANHRYFHDFSSAPTIYGTADGRQLIIKKG